jgi:hypothetical protein
MGIKDELKDLVYELIEKIRKNDYIGAVGGLGGMDAFVEEQDVKFRLLMKIDEIKEV